MIMTDAKRIQAQPHHPSPQQKSEDSMLPLPKRLEGCKVIYVRSHLISRLRECYDREQVLLSEAEYARICRTRAGRMFAEVFGYRPYSPERVLGWINS